MLLSLLTLACSCLVTACGSSQSATGTTMATDSSVPSINTNSAASSKAQIIFSGVEHATLDGSGEGQAVTMCADPLNGANAIRIQPKNGLYPSLLVAFDDSKAPKIGSFSAAQPEPNRHITIQGEVSPNYNYSNVQFVKEYSVPQNWTLTVNPDLSGTIDADLNYRFDENNPGPDEISMKTLHVRGSWKCTAR